MSDPKVGGHLLDPDSPDYWGFDLLQASITGGADGSSDLRPYSSSIHNQRQSSSCVANAVAKALEIRERKAKYDSGEAMNSGVQRVII